MQVISVESIAGGGACRRRSRGPHCGPRGAVMIGDSIHLDVRVVLVPRIALLLVWLVKE